MSAPHSHTNDQLTPLELAKCWASLPDDFGPDHISMKGLKILANEVIRLSALSDIKTTAVPELGRWAEIEKAKADAYEAAALICEEMSYPPEGQERWHGTDNEWAAIKLEDAAKAIRERKAKVCQITQAAPVSTSGARDQSAPCDIKSPPDDRVDDGLRGPQDLSASCVERAPQLGEPGYAAWKRAQSVVVPLEPTIEMMMAASSEHRKWEGEGNLVSAYWPRIYKAILAAAPSAVPAEKTP